MSVAAGRAVHHHAEGVRRRFRLLTPLATFPCLWLLCVGLAQIRLVELQEPWTHAMWVVALLVPLAFAAGGALAAPVAARLAHHTTLRLPVDGATHRVRLLLAAFLVTGYAALAYQFVSAGQIPLLADNIDAARFSLPEGPSIVLVNLLAVVVIASLVLVTEVRSRRAVPDIALAALALIGLASLAGRSLILLPLGVGLIARFLYRGIRSRGLFLIGGSMLLALANVLFAARVAQRSSAPFESELYELVAPALPWPVLPLLPVYLGLALNFDALARIVDYFPDHAPHGSGMYSLAPFDAAVSGAVDIRDVALRLSPPWNTTTLAGPLWADGGYLWVACGALLIGFIAVVLYSLARSTLRLSLLLVSSYVLYVVLYGVVESLLQRPDWVVIIPALIAVGWAADRAGASRASDLGRERDGWRVGMTSVAAVATLVPFLASALLMREIFNGARSSTQPTIYRIPSSLSDRFASAEAILGAAGADGERRLWLIEPPHRDGDRMIHVISLADGKLTQVHEGRLPSRVAGSAGLLATADWDDDGDDDLVLGRQDPASIALHVVTPEAPSTTRGRATVSIRAPARDTRRALGFDRALDSDLRLAVIDWGVGAPSGRLTLFSREAGFAQPLLSAVLPFPHEVAPSDWAFELLPRQSGYPDLLAIKLRSETGQLEFHVIEGASRYTRFSTHVSTGLPSDESHAYQFASATSAWRTRIFTVDRRQPRTMRAIPASAGE